MVVVSPVYMPHCRFIFVPKQSHPLLPVAQALAEEKPQARDRTQQTERTLINPVERGEPDDTEELRRGRPQ